MQKRLMLAPLLALALLLLGCVWEQEPYHVHADIKVFVNGTAPDLNKAEYMSSPYKPLSETVHLHNSDPDVVHFHSDKSTLGELFSGIGMAFTKECLDIGADEYCNDGEKTLQMYVNGAPNREFQDYKPRDLDRILIYYGFGKPSASDFASVTSKACIYSKKCPVPDGFVLPEESCSVGEPCTLEDGHS